MNGRNNIRRLTLAIFKINGIEYAIEQKAPVSSAEFCLMYALDDGLPHSQKQIAQQWEISKTTINTIVKRWEQEGLLILNKIPGKRREMEICLTENGLARAKGSLKNVYTAEDYAMKQTIAHYSDTFVEALEYYAEELKKTSERLETEHKENQ